MRRLRRTGPATRLVAVLAVLLVAGACSGQDAGDFGERAAQNSIGDMGGGSTATTVAEASDDAGSDGDTASPELQDGDENLGEGGVAPVALPTQIGRDIIFTAEMTVAVSDVGAAGEQATREVERLGGFLFGQRTTGSPSPSSILTFKVQPEDFAAALAALSSIGELRSQNVTASDVTERIVDLESRIQTAAASVGRLRALLAEATDIEAIVELESELLVRETELETLRGSLRTLQDQVALATIVLEITQAAANPQLTLEATAYPVHDSGMSCPGDTELQVETSTEITVCFEITNSGDTWLANFELRDPVLDVVLDDLVVVFGDPSTPLEPGDSLIVAAEVVPARDLRTQTTVTAEAVDEEGTELGGRPVSRTVTTFVDTVDPGGIPTFTEGLQASWQLLVNLGQALVLALGALIPFFWVPVLVWFLWTRIRRPAAPQD
jgi:hypothetical protein